jgi:hypothetical protein
MRTTVNLDKNAEQLLRRAVAHTTDADFIRFAEKILLDMNLPTSWVGFLRQEGFEAVHWSEIGDPLRAAEIEDGAVVSIDKVASRVRILSIGRAR